VRSTPFRPKGCKIWYIRYQRNGKRITESSRSEKKTVAENLLKLRLGEIQQGTYVSPVNRKITIADLYQTLLDNYSQNGMASLEGAKQRWAKRLERHFGAMQALALTSDHLDRYIAWCREQNLSNGTINRDLSALCRAFSLAVEDRKIPSAPRFRKLKEAPPRKGFVEEAQYRALVSNVNQLWLRGLLAGAYNFGLRAGELLELKVRQIDFTARMIRLDPGETKNGDGRDAPMTNGVYTVLAECCQSKQPNDPVFTRNGNRGILDFRERWATLTRKSGLDGLLFHDLRRSAVRNMIRRGVPEVVAMRISGHKTRSVFDRYNVVSEGDLHEAARKIEAGASQEMAKNWLKTPVLHQNRAQETLDENDRSLLN
jgi:integrase